MTVAMTPSTPGRSRLGTPFPEADVLLDLKPDGLLPLPTELLEDILALLPRADLASCALVNTAFYAYTLPLLYRHLILGVDEYRWPIFHPAPAPARLARLWNAPETYVETIDLHPHPRALCATFPKETPLLPKLSTLRIWITPGRAAYMHPFDCSVCPLFARVHPRRLIVRDSPLLYESPPSALSSIDAVRDAVLVLRADVALVGSNMKWEAGGAGAVGLTVALPRTVETLTVVFDTRTHGYWRPQPRPRNFRFPNEDKTQLHVESTWLGRLLFRSDGLFNLLQFRAPGIREVLLVNAEAIDPSTVLADADGGQHEKADVLVGLREAFREYIGEFEDWRYEDETGVYGAGKAVVRLLTMAEWVGTEGVVDVFNDDEVAVRTL